MKKSSAYRFNTEFEYEGKHYIAYVFPYFELTDAELIRYNISAYSYIAHLFSEEGFKTFELYPMQDLHWETNASPLLIDREIVQIIGRQIVNALR